VVSEVAMEEEELGEQVASEELGEQVASEQVVMGDPVVRQAVV